MYACPSDHPWSVVTGMLDHACLASQRWMPVKQLCTTARRHQHAGHCWVPRCAHGDGVLQTWAEQLSVFGLVAAYACWLQRPQGWADSNLIEVC